jgi:hypothetical protein
MKIIFFVLVIVGLTSQFAHAVCEDKAIKLTSTDAVNRLGTSMSGGISYYAKPNPKSPDGSIIEIDPQTYCIQYNGGDKVISYLVHSHDYGVFCKVHYDIHVGNNSCD